MQWFKYGAGALLAAVLTVGCGGGGGGSSSPATPPAPTPMTNADFTGVYQIGGLISQVSGDLRLTQFGTITADGSGMTDNLVGVNNDGTAGVPSSTTSTYTVAADGAFSLDAAVTGGLQRSGRGALAANLSPLSPPSLYVLLRRSGTYSNATLSGDYHLGLMLALGNSGGQSVWSTTAQGALAFDGGGGVTYPAVSSNSAGAQGAAGGGTAAYAITAAGELTLDSFTGSLVGSVTSGGSFGFAAGPGSAGGAPAMQVFTRRGSGMTAAAFNGEYWVAGIFSDPTDSGNWLAFSGTVTADGAGNMNYVSTTENFEGAIAPNSGPDTYTVSGDGTLRSGDRVGGITQDGEFAFYSGADSANGTPLLFVFMRKE